MTGFFVSLNPSFFDGYFAATYRLSLGSRSSLSQSGDLESLLSCQRSRPVTLRFIRKVEGKLQEGLPPASLGFTVDFISSGLLGLTFKNTRYLLLIFATSKLF